MSNIGFTDYWEEKKTLDILEIGGCVLEGLSTITHRSPTREIRLMRAHQLMDSESDDTQDVAKLINTIKEQPETFMGEVLATMNITEEELDAEEIRARANPNTQLLVTQIRLPNGIYHGARLTPLPGGDFQNNYLTHPTIKLEPGKKYPVFVFTKKLVEEN